MVSTLSLSIYDSECYSPKLLFAGILGERGGSVVERRTPKQEVGGSKPTAAVLCP